MAAGNSPSRFPKGIGFVKPNLYATRTDSITFAAGDTTPDISGSGFWQIHPTSGVTITGFDSGEKGRMFFLYSHSATLVTLASGNNIIFPPSIEVTSGGTGVSAGTGAGEQLVMQSNQVVQFLFIDNTKAAVVGGTVGDFTG